MNISVGLATYNGEKYIKQQIFSILPQLNKGDELLVIDDNSIDNTVNIVKEIDSEYIRIIVNKMNLGHVKTFEKLISLCKNEVIFMCDQDDIWVLNKVEIFKKYFKEFNAYLISDNSWFIDENGDEIESDLVKVYPEDSGNYSKNILNIYKGKAGYYGCAMAFNQDLKRIILPIPEYIESHDLWIAMAANVIKSNLHINEKTFFRRIHGKNDSLKKRKLIKKIISRWLFLKSHKELAIRMKNIKPTIP